MIRSLCAMLVLFAMSACATKQAVERPDPVSSLLEVGERVTLRMPAQLMHGHDMQEPYYDPSEGYRPIPTYQGELALTDRRLLFVGLDQQVETTPSWLSIPYEAVARARPSQTPLLHYLVIWDANGHPDSFVIDERNVRYLHRQFGEAMAARTNASRPASRHRLTEGN